MGTFEAVMLALGAAERIVALIGKLRERAKQNAEWTPEQEAEFENRWSTIRQSPHWQIDP